MKFSIITISYNSEKTIERTIKSILSQTYSDYEYIIVDGASKDSTIDVVKRYEPLFEGKMHWISEPDKGIYNAMNKGIAMAKGDVVGIVNSDDWLDVRGLENVKQCVESNNVSPQDAFIVTGQMLFHYDNGTSVVMKTNRQSYERYSRNYRMGLNHPATFVSRKVYEDVGTFDEKFKLYADADLMVRCYKAGVPVYFVEKVLSNMADGGASNVRSEASMHDNRYMLKKHTQTKLEYCWMMLKWRGLRLMKRLPYGWLMKFRKLKN